MIVRTWHGCVPVQHGDGFAAHLELTGVKHSQSIQGNAGAFVRRERQGNGSTSSSPPTGTLWRRLKPLLAKIITLR